MSIVLFSPQFWLFILGKCTNFEEKNGIIEDYVHWNNSVGLLSEITTSSYNGKMEIDFLFLIVGLLAYN